LSLVTLLLLIASVFALKCFSRDKGAKLLHTGYCATSSCYSRGFPNGDRWNGCINDDLGECTIITDGEKKSTEGCNSWNSPEEGNFTLCCCTDALCNGASSTLSALLIPLGLAFIMNV
ncbi:hypothetical protein PENTCL1PPCAC_13724, partial [Pristionchus entomophagus]